jgi:protein-S-isoprenylcysteine O-methyltransferase Ste14
MNPDSWIIDGLWLVLTVYWALSALRQKRNVGRRAWGREFAARAAVVVVIIAAARVQAVRRAVLALQAYLSHEALAGVAGVGLCALGVGLALWARVHIGRNWGMPMSRKERPELVTSGPYMLVRHPIYAGILLAMLGSALGETVFWGLPLVVGTLYFVYSARREERVMVEQFPEQYPAYRRRTKMLLPFVF